MGTVQARSALLPRLLVLTISLTLSGLVAWRVLRARTVEGSEGDTVELVDGRSALNEVLEERRAEAPSEAPGAGARLVRETIPKKRAFEMFAPLQRRGKNEYDPFVHFRRKGPARSRRKWSDHREGEYWVLHNSLGMREDAEPAAERPDLRILVAGDSHTEGVLPNVESFTNLLEHALSQSHPALEIEALNTGTGSYHFYNYLGVLERYSELRPHCFVVAVYGGNDFSGMMGLQRYFHHRKGVDNERFPMAKLMQFAENTQGRMSQEVSEVCYFLGNPEDVPLAVETASKISLEIERLCREAGVQLIFVYLPPPACGQPHLYPADDYATILEGLGLEPEDLRTSDELADAWLAFLQQRGIEHVDMRPIFRAAPEPYYWSADRHINDRAHRAVAGALRPLVRIP